MRQVFCALFSVPHYLLLPMWIVFAMGACAAMVAVGAVAGRVFASQLAIDADGNHYGDESDDAIYYDVLCVHILSCAFVRLNEE